MAAATNERLVEMLVDLDRRGIRLEANKDRLRHHPRSAVTPDLLARLKAHKSGLLAVLRPVIENQGVPPSTPPHAPEKLTKPICRCGSTTWRDVSIHGGRSTRRDCGRCGRFLEFPIWYGKATGQDGQHPIE